MATKKKVTQKGPVNPPIRKPRPKLPIPPIDADPDPPRPDNRGKKRK